MGKAIYNPSGKAGEYSYWACNFYNGCSADCEYCYCKKGPMGSLWSTIPTLKKTLVDELTAIKIFGKEVNKNLAELREHGLFFNFSSDPFLRETIDLNTEAIKYCSSLDIPTKVLTKQTWWIGEYGIPKDTAIGFTLTGHDEFEPGAATNLDRIEAMKYLYGQRYKIWASIEPVIDIEKSFSMIQRCSSFVDHYKIGPLSGQKFDKEEVLSFIETVNYWIDVTSIYWKEEFIEKMGITRDSLPDNCVNRDYRWWE